MMGPGEDQLQRPGPVRELWARAAVRELFRAGELLSEWIVANPDAGRETIRAARRAALELQDAAEPALGADGQPAYRLGESERLKVLWAIGAREALEILERAPPSERTETEKLLAQLLAGDNAAPDVQDRDQLVALSQMGPLAEAAGASVRVDTEALRQHLDSLDFLNLVGGPDLHRFVGRADELAELRRLWDSGDEGSVLIEAPGGVGKSMLISRFIADLLETPDARPTAVFHIDFDRRDMQSARPATILSEMLRQSPRWVGSERRDEARRLAATAQRAPGQDYHGQSRSLESMGDLADHRIISLIGLLDPSQGDFRVIIVADSAEQVFGFDDVAAESPKLVADDFSRAMHSASSRPGRRTQVVLIYGARYFPPTWVGRPLSKITLNVFSPDEATVYLRAEAARANTSVSDGILGQVIEAVGRSPLALRLAARLLASEDARTDPKTWVDAARNDPERIQATLYDRVLKRLRDPNLQKLAKPGLLLRRVTPAIVERVLAGPCELDLGQVTPEELIAKSAQEGQLFFRDVSDPDPRALWHRPDVRAQMLPDLDATIDATLATAINMAAVDYYARRDDAVSRAEEIYHRLRLDQPESEVAARWTEASGEKLKRSLDEFPPRARDFIRGRLDAASLTEVEARLERSRANQPEVDAQALAELRGVVRRELQRGAAPLETLVRYNVDTLDGVLGDIYAVVLVASGQIDKLLADARDLRTREGIVSPSARAAVFATTAGVLEGQGELGEALPYWTEARIPSQEADEEAALTELGGVVGWLRTRRKLGLVEGREAELEQLAQRMEQHVSTLVSRPVLLREVVAELGDIISGRFTLARSTPESTYQRLLGSLFETEEAFPSAVADPRRLNILSEQLGLDGPASSPRMLGDLAFKAAYSGREHAQQVVAMLREEVDWTLAEAVSRPRSRRARRKQERDVPIRYREPWRIFLGQERPHISGAPASSAFPVIASAQFNFQAAQGLGNVPFQNLNPLASGLQPAQLASPFSLRPFGLSPFAVMQAVQEKPTIEELFEVITDPEIIPRALFQTEQTTGIAPYDLEYVNAREDIPDIQLALGTALREARGRLLICGSSGIGKTREMVELARAECATGWRVLVARNEANLRMGPLTTMPPELSDAKLLIIIDNIHARIIASADQPIPQYMERLEQLLDWLQLRLPGNVRVLAAAQDEPRFQPYLNLSRQEKLWHSFGLFRLPKLTDEGLRRMLATLAARARVPVAADDVAGLIDNSDRKPATVFINVDLARRYRTNLTQSVWRPTEGEAWSLRFASARAKHPGLDRVCQALYLLIEAGVPARSSYVIAVARWFGERHSDEVVNALVGEGLFKIRRGTLAPFSTEQLRELLGEGGASAANLEELADIIEGAITAPANRSAEWPQDLLALSIGLARANSNQRAEQVASSVIESGAGGSRAYRIRAAIRFERWDLAGGEADLTKAIEIGGNEGDAYFGRAAMRNLLGNFAGALEDLDVVLQHGRNDAEVYGLRGNAFYQQAKWADAETEMSAAIERGATSGGMLFSRGMVRVNLNDLAGAEKDLSAALERGVDLEETAGQLRKIQSGARPELALLPSSNPRSTDPIISSLLGIVRLRLGRSKEAEEDFTAAIDGGAGESFGSFMDALKESTLPMFDALKDRLKNVQMPSPGTLFHLRGASRLNLGKLSEAETDFERALSLGWAEGEVYFGRGWARLGLGRFVDAEQDAEMALERGMKDASTYALCGLAHLNLKHFAGAEQDFAKAIELDADNAQLFAWRGAARLNLNKLPEAEADLTASLGRRADAQTLFLRGCVRFDMQKHPEAEEDLTAALELGFDQAQAAALFVIRGSARLAQNKVTEADEDVTAAFAGMPADMPALLLIQVYSVRAGVRLEQQRHAEAEQDATAALSLGFDPAQAAALFTIRGSARLAQNKVTEADEDVTAAFAGIAADTPAPVLIPAYSLRAALRFEQERYAEADLDFTEAMRLGRKDAFVLFNRGRARQALERYTEAEQDYDATIALGKDAAISMGVVPAEVFVNRGRTQAALQRWHEAEQNFIGAIEAGRDDAFVHVYVGLALQEQKRYSEAETEFDLAIARDSQPLVRFQRGSLRLIRGNFRGAESDFDEIITRETTNASALHARGLSRYGQQKDAEALADYNAALVLSPKEGSFFGSRVAVHLRLGNLDEAAKDCAQLGEMDAGATDAEACYGLLQLARGDLDGALGHLTTAGPRDSSWCYWQGLVLLLVCRLEEAQEAYAKASTETTPADILIALDELDIYLRQHPTQAVSPDAKSTIAHIQSQLRRQFDTMNGRVGLQERTRSSIRGEY